MRTAGQEKRLRLTLVLRETNVESGEAESLTPTLIDSFSVFKPLGMMPRHGSLRCSVIASKKTTKKKQEKDNESLKGGSSSR